MAGLGRVLVVTGLLLAVLGLLLLFADRLPLRPGRLPGDLVFKGKNTTVYFPVMTSLLLSALLTLLFWLFGRR